MHQKIADATFRILAGNSSGSGFSYVSDRIVITNHHVIEPHLISGAEIVAVTENEMALPAKLLAYSPKDKADFAVLELQQGLPAGREILQPAANPVTSRGSRVLFAGFPHGIHHLLVHEAVVSAPFLDYAFYVDGSVNGGNSGGPIVDEKTGQLLGIVTQRRFMGGGALETLAPQIEQLSAHCKSIAARVNVGINGINFGEFALMMANGLTALSQVTQMNANAGIGIGFHTKFVNEELQRLGLLPKS